MEVTSAVSPLSATTPDRTSRSLSELGSNEFLSLLITQLRNQDPFEPMSNVELLTQIASVRDIELSTTLTDSLTTLAGQQRFGPASSMIGQYVSGVADAGDVRGGIVVGVRFVEGGLSVLQLSDGSELPVDRVTTIQPPLALAESLVGVGVVGVDRRDQSDVTAVEGVVTTVRSDRSGEVILELDSGDELRLRDLIQVGSVTGN